MARCLICGKTTAFGNNVSHANNRTSRKFKANIRRIKVFTDGKEKRIKVCTSCIKMGKHISILQKSV